MTPTPNWKCAEEIDGWMSSLELAWLREQAAECESVVEIGCWKGRSTWALCESCPGLVHAVDWWGGSNDGNVGAFDELNYLDVHQVFLNNVGHFPNLRVHKMKSRTFAKHRTCPDHVDMVFIDGDHSYGAVLADLKNWWPKCSKLMCGHDASWPGVQKALNEFAPGRWKVVVGEIWKIYPVTLADMMKGQTQKGVNVK